MMRIKEEQIKETAILSSKGNRGSAALLSQGREQLLSPVAMRTGREGGGWFSCQHALPPPMLKNDESNILQANMSLCFGVIPAYCGAAL